MNKKPTAFGGFLREKFSRFFLLLRKKMSRLNLDKTSRGKDEDDEIPLTFLQKIKAEFLMPRFSMRDRIHFSKKLSFLVQGGIPILESLTILQKQNKSKGKKVFFATLIADVSSGQYLSTSLTRFKNSFGDFAIHIIRVGEMSGILNQNLNYLAEDLRKKQALKQKIFGALLYPIFVTVATISLTALLTVFIFPKILPIFKSLKITIPFTTKVLIWISDFLRHDGLLMILIFAVLAILYMVLMRTVKGFRFFVDRTMLRLPLLKSLVQSYNMANFARTLGLLLKSGIVLSEAVSITAETTTNLVFKKELESLSESVLRGDRISNYLEKRTDFFPDMLSHMISVGETTGNLPDSLLYLADMYEHEVDDMTKNLASSIEPVLMIVMGIMVGIVAISVISPIYEITQNLHAK